MPTSSWAQQQTGVVNDCANGDVGVGVGGSSRFQTRAVAEYTNSISASRDTNISPQEAYETMQRFIPINNHGCAAKALDVGAGAGLSTSILYQQLNYRDIDAVDWSGVAWRSNVLECPTTIRFFEMDDDSFFRIMSPTTTTAASKVEHHQQQRKRYQIICYNFAVNLNKALRVARDHLAADGVLFAPINDQPDYWYKQTYYVLNARGEVLQKSNAEVGAWSVQFQPDVTSSTCTGIWCGNMNGFQQKQRAQ